MAIWRDDEQVLIFFVRYSPYCFGRRIALSSRISNKLVYLYSAAASGERNTEYRLIANASTLGVIFTPFKLMIYLLSILLLFGLFQSFLELKKDGSDKPQALLKKILSALYILGFILGIMVILLQNNESDEVNNLIKDISKSVTKIDSTSIEQVSKIGRTIEQTESLVSQSNNLNNGMIQVLKIKDSLLEQYKYVNSELGKQLELDKQKLKERSPDIDLKNYDVKWTGTDSTSYVIEACITNFGKRNATILGGKGYVLLFDNQKKPFANIPIVGNTNQGILESNQINGMRHCYNSYGVYDFKIVKRNINFAVICLKVIYKDELLNIEKEKKFYVGFTGIRTDEFGGLKDWQVGLAKIWEADNYKF